jgi:hypothetical protein
VSEVQKRVAAQSDTINDARDQLNSTDDPQQHRQIVAGVRRKLSNISGAQTAAGQLPQGAGKVIDKATAQQFYEAAGRDPNKARDLAIQSGWKVQ